MKWLVDNQLPHALCTALKKRGHQAIHTSELPGSHRTKDEYIRELADREDYVVVTKDEDFLVSYKISDSPKKLVYISTGNIRNREFVFLFMHFLEELCQCMKDGGLAELDRTRLVVR